MNRLTRRLTIYLVLVLIIFLIGVEHNIISNRNYIEEKIESQLIFSSKIMHDDVEDWVEHSKRVMAGIARSTSYFEWDYAQLNHYLKDLAQTYPDFSVFYYVDENGVVANSNDRQSSAFLDMTNQEWYKNAINSKGVYITQPYIDALSGETIVTISEVIEDESGNAVAVVAGDLLLTNLRNKVDNYNFETAGEYILFDTTLPDESGILAHHLNQVCSHQLFDWYKNYTTDYDDELNAHLIEYEGTTGYFSNYMIADTNWCIVNYAPMSAFSDLLKNHRWVSYVSYCILIVFIIVFYVLYKLYIVNPLLGLGDKVSRINVVQNPSYRLNDEEEVLFNPILKSINQILGQVESNMHDMEQDKEEIYAMNEELEATIQQMRAAEQEVTRQTLNFEAMFYNNQSAVAMVNQQHMITNVNDAFIKLFGYVLEEVKGKDLDDIVAPIKVHEEATKHTHSLLAGEHVLIEGVRYDKELKPIDVRVQGIPIKHRGELVGCFSIYTDITHLKNQEKARYYASTHDDLTGLYNRSYFNEQLRKYKEEGALLVSLIVIDINGFKMVNEAFGLTFGDQLLVDITRKLETVCSTNQILTRYGGDEFAILSKGISSIDIGELARNIKVTCGEMKLNEIEISLSVGWAIKETLEEGSRELIRNAEDDLYRHKMMESSSVKGKTVYTMINTLHETNKREEQHSRRVSALCEEFGHVLTLPDRDMNALKTMSLLHDIGKVAIDEKILNKAGSLTEEEYAEIKRHPEIGYRILSSVSELSEIAEYVLSHHERWDGKGYPNGLEQHEIPYLARIITIVDAYDAMTSNRSYREAQDEDWAIRELERNAGTQFDPFLVPIFISIMTS